MVKLPIILARSAWQIFGLAIFSSQEVQEQHRHWATRVHPVMNAGTFDSHAITCSFTMFFLGVLSALQLQTGSYH